MAGWIKLHRQLLEWEWYDDVNVCRLFLHLLLKANHKDKMWKGVEVKAGSLITGRQSLSQETGLTEQQVRTALDKLKSTGEITSKTTNKFSVITITSWDSYQQDNQQTTNQITNEQPTNNHKQECKNVKKENTAARLPSIPWDEILQAYNEILPEFVSHERVLDDARANINRIWKNEPKYRTVDFWRAYFTGIRSLPAEFAHWSGENDRNRTYGTLGFITHGKRFYETRDKLRDQARKAS